MPAVTAIRGVTRAAHRFPIGSQIGLAIMVFGLVADLVAHLDPVLEHDHGGATGPELSAHLVIFVGMALVLVGVVVDGVHSDRQSGVSSARAR